MNTRELTTEQLDLLAKVAKDAESLQIWSEEMQPALRDLLDYSSPLRHMFPKRSDAAHLGAKKETVEVFANVLFHTKEADTSVAIKLEQATTTLYKTLLQEEAKVLVGVLRDRSEVRTVTGPRDLRGAEKVLVRRAEIDAFKTWCGAAFDEVTEEPLRAAGFRGAVLGAVVMVMSDDVLFDATPAGFLFAVSDRERDPVFSWGTPDLHAAVGWLVGQPVRTVSFVEKLHLWAGAPTVGWSARWRNDAGA